MSQEDEQENTATGQSLMLAGGTLLTVEAISALAHWGPTGLVVGGIASFIAWRQGPDMLQNIMNALPPQQDTITHTLQQPIQAPTYRGKRSFLDRVAGRFPEAVVVEQEQEYDDVDEPVVTEGKLQVGNDEKTAMQLPLGDVLEQYNPALHREHMVFAPTLFPHANQVYSGRKALFGVSDAGKSNNIAVLAEEYARFGAPVILFDTEGEYESLCDTKYFPRPRHMDASTLPPDRAFQFAHEVMDNLLQVVINLQSYEDEQAAWVMVNMIKGVQHWEESASSEDRVPCEIILDEATVWLPQTASESSLSKVMVDDPDGSEDEQGNVQQISMLSILQRAFFSVLVRRGRKRGMGFTLAAQRIAEIDKRALSCSWTFLMRQTQAVDFAVYKKFGIEARQAVSLRPGEAFVFAPGKSMEQHRFRMRRSPHGAVTPGLSGLQKHQSRVAQGRPMIREQRVQQPPRPIANVTNMQSWQRQTVPPVMEDIADMQKKASQTLTPPQRETTGHFTSSLSQEEMMALRLYQTGMTYRDLATLMTQHGFKMKKDKAGEVLKALKAKRLIA